MGKKEILSFILFFLAVFIIPSLTLASPSLIYQVNGSAQVVFPVNQSSCNITVFSPNGTRVVNNQVMSVSSGYANYTYQNATSLGTYNYFSGLCGSGTFIVTPNGQQFSIPEGVVIFLTELFLIGLLILTIYLNTKISGEETKSDSDGKIFAVNNMRLFKPVIWFCSYLIYLLIVFTAYSTVYLYDVSEIISGFMYALWFSSLVGSLAVMVIVIVNIISGILLNKKIWKAIALED